MQKVLALDPGITTGYAIAVIGEKLLICCDEGRLSHRQLWEIMGDIEPDQIVCESFEYRNRQRDNLELFSRELIGVAKLFQSLHSGTGLELQSAAKGKGFWNDTNLRKHGLYVKGKKHGRDAVRHLLHWYMFGPGFRYNKNQQMVLVNQERVMENI